MTRGLLFALLLLISIGWETVQAAEPLGRLFFTPAQRNRLDAGKKLYSDAIAAPIRRGPAAVTLNGVVLRSDGENTVWVNGRPTNRSTSGNVVATPTTDPTSAQVKVPGSATRKMRVGQHLDTRTGIVRESYARGSREVAVPDDNPADSPTAPAANGNVANEEQASRNSSAGRPAGQR